MTWQAQASCASLPIKEADRLFFGDGRSTAIAEARLMCLACPVLDQCRALCDESEADVVTHDFLAGIWAAETHHERAARRRVARAQQRQAAS